MDLLNEKEQTESKVLTFLKKNRQAYDLMKTLLWSNLIEIRIFTL